MSRDIPYAVSDAFGTQLKSDHPPVGFDVNVSYKRDGSAVIKYDAWVAMIYCLVDLSEKDWNQSLKAVRCGRNPYMAISVIGNNVPDRPRLLMKHVMWAILEVNQWWESKDEPHYAETTFEIKLDGSRLGFGQLLIKPFACDNGSSVPREFATSKRSSELDDEVTSPDELQSCTKELDTMSKNDALNRPPNVPNQNGLLGKRGCEVRIEYYKPYTQVCAAATFYAMIMFSLIVMGERGISEVSDGLAIYFSMDDFTFVMDATSTAAREAGVLKNFMVVGAIETLTDLITDRETVYKYHGLKGIFKWNGPVVGKIFFFKGTEPPETESVDGGGGFLTS